MKKSKKKILSFIIIILIIISLGINVYAHSGRTDASGGHKDNNNKSGLGNYHYHCGGNPPHLHTNGICPYSSNSEPETPSSITTYTPSTEKTTVSESNTNTKETNAKPISQEPEKIEASNIQINEEIESMEIGENRTLTATITPSNADDKNITWKSNDESVATVSTEGEIVAKSAGNVEITASTSNGKTSTIKIYVKGKIEEKVEEQNTNIIKTIATIDNSNYTNDNSITTDEEETSTLGGVVTLGLIGGGSYWGYKKYKNKK